MILNKTLYHTAGHLMTFTKSMLLSLWPLVRNLHRVPSKYAYSNFTQDAYSPRLRGLPYLVRREDNNLRCNACLLCQKICPTQCLQIVPEEKGGETRPKSFVLDALRCLYCGMCVEACPVDAIRMSHKHQLAGYAETPWAFEGEELEKYASGESKGSKAKQ
jgi:NADH-quinone oxidoreductase subunit I